MKRFFRSNNKMIAGVCSGLANYFGIDPILVRIFFVISFFFHGMGFLAYILLWIVSDYAPIEDEYSSELPQRNGKNILGYILVISGAYLLLEDLIPDFDAHIMFGIILLAIGGALIYKNLKKSSYREQQI